MNTQTNNKGDTINTINSHLKDLQQKIVLTLLYWVTCFLGSLYYAKEVLTYLPRFIDFKLLNTSIIFNSPFEVINLYLLLSLVISLFLTFPIIVVHTYLFIQPALSQENQKVFLKYCLLSVLLFIFGVGIGYFVLVKLSLGLLFSMSAPFGIPILWSLTALTQFIFIAPLLVGVGFQFPVFIMGLLKIGIVDTKLLKENRRGVLLLMLLLAGIITPGGDILTMFILTLPLYTLYEGVILLGGEHARNE